MRNNLYVIALAVFLASCTSSKPAVTKMVPAKTSAKATTPATVSKPKVQVSHEETEFYKINIADAAKNDNTISYGSIVSAKVPGYQIVKTYFPAVAQNFRQKYIILHYTVLDDEKSISVLTQQAVSAHYLVNDLGDREIYQLVDENKRAYHAGLSSWRSDQMLNDTSVGIEIVNAGYSTDSLGNRVFADFSEAQFKKVAALVKDIAARYMIPPTNVLGHSDIAPTRKQDPGPKFPWKRLYDEYKIGMWYDEETKQFFLNQTPPELFAIDAGSPQFIYKYQLALKTFGFGLTTSGVYDDATKKTIEAFQYHFRPENSSGIMDAETWAILQALNQKYPTK